MKFDAFAARAEEILAAIPPEFLRGVTGVEAHRGSKSHPQLPDFFTLGECGDDEVSAMTDPAALRSRVHLYHGSFRKVAARRPGFDWDAELTETILHEIRHHLEDRAGIPDLLEEDAQDEALARFHAGEELPDGWYRHGEEREPGVWAVAEDLFVELRLRPEEFDALRGGTASLTILGEPLEADIPDDVEAGEILGYEGEGLERPDGAGDLHLILVAR